MAAGLTCGRRACRDSTDSHAFTMFFGWFLLPEYWIAVGADA